MEQMSGSRGADVSGTISAEDPAGQAGVAWESAMAKVLLIEDDPQTAREIMAELSERGFEVDWAATGVEGLDKARAGKADALIVDRLLPGVDGLTIIEVMRQERLRTPVLVLSALGAVDERVRGLRAGGDDYLVKPFAFAELLARVEALARRSLTVIKETLLRVGDLELDLVTRTANRGGREIDLLPREFQVLEYLVRNQGQVVPRAMLLQHVWDLHFDPTTNVIDVYVGRVRRKIDDSQAYPLIHTVRGVGFCVRAPC
jgi:two-component system, OmpR family, response regulator